MEKQGFSVSEAFGVGWELWKKHWTILTGAFLLSLILPAIPSVLSGLLSEHAIWAHFFLSIVNYILTLLVGIGLIVVYLKVLRGETTSIGDFFEKYYLLPSYFGASLLYYLAVGLGLVLFIVPGIILGLMFCLYSFFVVDKNYGVIESLKASRKATYGSKWDLFLLGIASFALNILGALALGIGLLITIPITILAWAWVYIKLSEVSETEDRTII